MSRLPFELFLALRYLHPKRTFVSVITLISIVGVTLGVAVLIIVLSVMTGFDRQLRDRILGFNAHLKISKRTSTLRNPEPVVTTVAGQPLVRGVAPTVIGPVLLKCESRDGTTRIWAPYVRGIDPRREPGVSNLGSSVVEGAFDVRGNGLVVGADLAASLDLHVGDIVGIHSPANLEKMERSRAQGAEEAYLPVEFVVRGIFDVGYYEYNNLFIICSIANAQDLYGLEDAVHGLMVMLRDPMQADAARTQIAAALGPDYRITTWLEENSAILDALAVEKSVMFYLLFFIMVVAAFGITSALITFAVQKTREIGVLKALGATRAQIVALFLSQSMIVGVIGVACGFQLGLLAVDYRNEFLHFMNRLTGFELFPARIYGFAELPALVIPADVAVICGSALVICVLAGVLPAWNAGRLQPVEALRHE
jgi:lipoprotein-releasing system permease protein